MKLQKYKRNSDYSYAFGATLVDELLKTNPKLIKRIFLRPTTKHGDDLNRIIEAIKKHQIEIIESTKAFNILSAKDNCLLIAEFAKTQAQLDDSTPHIILVNPSDSGNLGTIIRTAAAFNYRNIAIIKPAIDHYDPKVVRASMGAFFHVNIAVFDNIKEYLAQNQTRQLYAFMLDQNAKTLEQTTKPADNNFAIVFGNEAAGLPKDFCNTTNATAIYIPQSADVDSLNLSVAAAIAMHHFSI